jgi:photosynthetic reaction center M subunit
MAYFEYQNIFTQVQVQGEPEMGMDQTGENILGGERTEGGVLAPCWIGWFGNAQLGPIYLGWAGAGEPRHGHLLVQHRRLQHAGAGRLVDPGVHPAAVLAGAGAAGPGIRAVMPPLNDGGWYIIASFFLLVSVMTWWLRTYLLARSTRWASISPGPSLAAIWLFLVLGLFRPILMGSWSEAVPYGIFPHLDWTTAFSIRYGNLYYNPFHCLSIVFLYGSVLLFAMHGATILAVTRYGGDRELEQIATAARRRNVRPSSGAGPWASTPRWKAFTAGPGGSRS